MVRHSLLGAAAAIACSPVAAGLIAAVYRFPVPFHGYVSGIGAAPTAALAALFYLLVGGVVVVGGLGAAAGAVLSRNLAGRATGWTLIAAAATAVAGAVALAVLEHIIGPW